LAACGQAADRQTAAETASGTPPAAEAEGAESDAAEVSAPAPRLVITYEGGVQVLDALTLALVEDIPLDGFNRLNPAGDGRHVFVSTAGGFRLLDTGVFAAAHGDHFHYYAATPVLEDGVGYPAERPGHVVPHDDLTALFDDATGHVVVVEADDLDRVVREYTSPAAHHGVAVALPDGTLLVTEGTEESRSGLLALDQADAVKAQSAECPGIHGEAVAAGEAAGFGCEGGALVYADGAIRFVASPDPDGQITSLAGSEDSAVLLGNYQQAGSEQPSTKVSLVDTAAGEIKTVDLGTPYSGRGLSTRPDGAALVLGTDGKLHVIDPATAQETAAYQVIDPFTVPEDWQAPVPGVTMLAGMAYVTAPDAKTIHIVDPATGKIWRSGALTVTPNEVAGATGEGAGEHEHDHEGEEDAE
jgi:dipeptidyl aminopeptidase/acylaminoacyl peptidase